MQEGKYIIRIYRDIHIDTDIDIGKRRSSSRRGSIRRSTRRGSTRRSKKKKRKKMPWLYLVSCDNL